jgi:Arc/MetJ family transcription regulator
MHDSVDLMRTTLELPDGIVDEARTALGFKSKTETVVHALREVIRRSRLDDLKALLGTVELEYDPAELRARDRSRG